MMFAPFTVPFVCFFFFRIRFSVNPYGFMVWYGDCNWTFFVNPYACMYGHLRIVLKSFSFKCGSFMLSTSPRPYNRFTDIEHTSISNERFVECSSAVQFEVGCADVARIVCCVSIDIPHFWEVFWGAVMNFLSIGVSHLNVWLGCWCLFLVYRKHRTHTTNGLQFCSGAFARRLCPFERAALESSVNYQRHKGIPNCVEATGLPFLFLKIKLLGSDQGSHAHANDCTLSGYDTPAGVYLEVEMQFITKRCATVAPRQRLKSLLTLTRVNL